MLAFNVVSKWGGGGAERVDKESSPKVGIEFREFGIWQCGYRLELQAYISYEKSTTSCSSSNRSSIEN